MRHAYSHDDMGHIFPHIKDIACCFFPSVVHRHTLLCRKPDNAHHLSAKAQKSKSAAFQGRDFAGPSFGNSLYYPNHRADAYHCRQ